MAQPVHSMSLPDIPGAPTRSFSFEASLPSSVPSASSSSARQDTLLKQRRVSLAFPSSSRVSWNFRDDTGLDSHVTENNSRPLVPEKREKVKKIVPGKDNEVFHEKKQRKRWTEEETQMLVTGCNIHGVGNWKTILRDPVLKFDNRSPVDLKDRFRTYFPDAYKEYYPNARTHLSSKVRSTLPDGSSLFEKTRSKKRRPFTEAEDRALKAGYEKHGTVWAAIVKDPIFKEQNRRSTDLRDRFRNAFPELYQAAGYKPRNAAKKKPTVDGVSLPTRSATDDQLSMSSTGPVRRNRGSRTKQGFLRGGTKSVPQSTACSEDEASSAEEESPNFKIPRTPVVAPDSSATVVYSCKSNNFGDKETSPISVDPSQESFNIFDPLAPSQTSVFPNLTTDLESHSQTWSSGISTPTRSIHTKSTAATSPASSHLSIDQITASTSHSPTFDRQNTDPLSNIGMIGKSAWGTQDWFSPNPRLDTSMAEGTADSATLNTSSDNANTTTTNGGSPEDLFSPPPPSPLPFLHNPVHHAFVHPHLFSLSSLVNQDYHGNGHGVLDRYDLQPTTLFPHDFASEVGDTHSSTFSDEHLLPPPSGFRGFTHHSHYAGDLIFGARPTVHNQTHLHQSSLGGFATSVPEATFESLGGGASDSVVGNVGRGDTNVGLGLSAEATIHPMALALPCIDEVNLTDITLEDEGHSSKHQLEATETRMGGMEDSGIMVHELAIMGRKTSPFPHLSHSQQDLSEATSSQTPTCSSAADVRMVIMSPFTSTHDLDQDQDPKFSLDDLVDLSVHEHDNADDELCDPVLHATPPGTPVISHVSRKLTRTINSVPSTISHGLHGRSVSVPPSEVRCGVESLDKTIGTKAQVFERLGREEQTQDAMALDLAKSSGEVSGGELWSWRLCT